MNWRNTESRAVHNSPNVGRNLQDHTHVGVAYHAHNMEDFDSELRADKLTLAVLNWVLFKKGYLTTLPVGCLAYIRTRPELSRPDIELLMGRLHPEAKIWFPGIDAGQGRLSRLPSDIDSSRKPRHGYAALRQVFRQAGDPAQLSLGAG